MAVRVEISPVLRRFTPGYNADTGMVLDDANGLSVRLVIARTGVPIDEVMAVIINGYPGKLDDIVNDGDVVALIKIMGGG